MSDQLDIFDLLMHGEDTLIGMATRGELRPRHLWVAIKGAKKYRAAIRAGDLRRDVDANRFVQTCNNCPSCTREEAVIAGQAVVKMYCGPSFEDRLDRPQPTCGCFVGLRIDGELAPGGKSMVNSEKCPQNRT